MMVNPDGKVFVGKRIDTKEGDWWQMPQGGVDPGEDLADAALRELAEETGASAESVSLIGRLDEPMRYDLPEELIGKLWGGQYRGQEQVWFLARFNGAEEELDLNLHSEPEFSEYRWVDLEDLPDLIVPFKKRVYRAVVEGFRALV
ncbi:RNA pyrophosphohydrolase [Altererythrobacter sp. TH136]|uniref:RNA pyrophosphohydrolase n=1 Tax=Altererythrobacter sp. TH136 TaxID=2067415 RepID=UPI001FED613D|nr:RNA pyrophosphohydrolase [Altererythrobacter sp. TH136]